MAGDVLDPIPWIYTETPNMVMWTWQTPHFVAKITSVEAQGLELVNGSRAVKAYSWEIGDLVRPNQGLPRFLMEGMTNSFREAEELVRENIGKSYSLKYGYTGFSGSLSNTFTIATGERVDFTKFINTDCSLTVRLPDGGERRINGVLNVSHYKIRVRSDRRTLELRPEHITSIVNASAIAARADALKGGDTYSGIGRIYNVEFKRGCTGTPGFMPNTVDHAGAPLCPIHEGHTMMGYHKR